MTSVTVSNTNPTFAKICAENPTMTMNQLYNVVVFFANYYSDDVEWDTTHPDFYIIGSYDEGSFYYAGITKTLYHVDGRYDSSSRHIEENGYFELYNYLKQHRVSGPDVSGPDVSGPDASLVKPYLPSIPEESVERDRKVQQELTTFENYETQRETSCILM